MVIIATVTTQLHMNTVPWSKLLTCEMFNCWFIGNKVLCKEQVQLN